MSLRKLQKYISNTEGFDHGLPPLRITPIVISDSKGVYLEQICQSQLERSIVWKCARSRTSTAGLDCISSRIDSWIRQYGRIRLYIFLGTCDFTTLVGDRRYLFLNDNPHNEISDSVISIRNFERIVELAHSKNIEVTLLEIPFFSIKKWNTKRGHPRPSSFEIEDKNLSTIIKSVNEHIHRINRLNQAHAPLLNVDLEVSRKNHRQRIRYYTSYNLYHDGVHPIHELNKCWLRKISVQIRQDCY